jgi:ribonuclease T2
MFRASFVWAGLMAVAAAAHLRSYSQVAPLGGTCSGTTYDYFELETQYPIALCKDGVFSCTSNSTWFTLHGLWPNDDNGNYPCTCTNQVFDPTQIQDLLPELNAFWPSLNGPSDSFWSHEYTKHGTCAEDVYPTEHDFFAGALALLAKYNATEALATAGIVPSNTKGFTMPALKQAFSTAYGGAPMVTCNSQGHVEGLTICINKQTLAVETCPSTESDSCSASTLYLLASM